MRDGHSINIVIINGEISVAIASKKASGTIYWYPRTRPHTREYSTSVGNTS